MRTQVFSLALGCLLAAFLLATCSKKNTSPSAGSDKTTSTGQGATPYYVRLTDAPAAVYNQVNVDIQGIQLTSNGVNINLNITPGIYNLLDFTNGVDTLIATGSLSVQTVQQIRLILGSANTIMVDSVIYPLEVPSGSESGLKLQVHQTLQPGIAYEVLLDFDASKSIVATGNGKYLLKPVIKTTETAVSGAINGVIVPPGVTTTVTAVSGANSYSTMADPNGNFFIGGVAPANNYTVTATPVAPYTQTAVTNVTVTVGSTTNTGTLNI
jgi:hypothetical protein